ncbi:hypothetical protein ACTFIY_000542 [Dictyostelium cf. discoideum]
MFLNNSVKLECIELQFFEKDGKYFSSGDFFFYCSSCSKWFLDQLMNAIKCNERFKSKRTIHKGIVKENLSIFDKKNEDENLNKKRENFKFYFNKPLKNNLM